MRSITPLHGRRRGSDRRTKVKLAVFGAGDNPEKGLERLRRDERFRLASFSPRRTLTTLLPTACDAVLWELSSGHRPDRQRVAALAARLPVLSYSASSSRQVSALSRELGFTAHLRAPVIPTDVDEQIARLARVDLFARIRVAQSTLRTLLASRAVLADVVEAVTPTLEPKRVVGALLDRVASWFPAQNWAVVTMHESGELATIVDRGVSPLLDGQLEDLARWLIDRGTEFAAPNLAEARRGRTRRAVSAFALPLRCRGRTIGVIVAAELGASTGTIQWTSAQQAALRAILTPAAYALDNALRYQRAQALSVTDDLTQLYNSRYLNQVLRRETKRASRSGRPLSLLFMDLDGFKAINDHHGHLSGSRALVEAAEVVRASARETDVAARFGGDEFAIILPDTGGEGAYAVGERIRERIAAHEFLAVEGLTIRLTASVGLATLPDVAASAEELIRAADRAMYTVKDRGKNGIIVAMEEGVNTEIEETR